MADQPRVVIVEQPASKHRFRYASEVSPARTVGSLPGASSTPERRTYPTIAVPGYSGPMVVVLSLVNPDDHLVHPHSVTGSDRQRYHCNRGVIYMFADGPEVVFNNIGILCVRRKSGQDIVDALNDRREAHIDPFGAGFEHIGAHGRIDFDAVRLCFSVFLPGPGWAPARARDVRAYSRRLPPRLSAAVRNLATLGELRIVRVSRCAGSVLGGTEMFLLCDKYSGTHPDVVFEGDGWEAKADVKLYHKQFAIVFETPRYRDLNCTRPVEVDVYLQRAGPRGAERSRRAAVELLPQHPRPAGTDVQAPPHPTLSEVGVKRPPPDYLASKAKKPTLAQQCAWSKAHAAPPVHGAAEAAGMAGAIFCGAQPPGASWQQPDTPAGGQLLNPLYFTNNATPSETLGTMGTNNPLLNVTGATNMMANESYMLPDVNTPNCVHDSHVHRGYPLTPFCYTHPNVATTSVNTVVPSQSNCDVMLSPGLYPNKENVTINTTAPLPNVIPTVQSLNLPPDVLSVSPDVSNFNYNDNLLNVDDINNDDLVRFVHSLIQNADEEMLSDELKKLCNI